ncbi:MAG: hypothetical protein ABIL62_02775, partial [Planctomycetota bacterium]
MSTDSNKDHIGAIVKARTLALQKTSSNLARRAIQDIDRLTTDPHVSELIRHMGSSSEWEERENAWIELRKMGPTYRGWAESLRNIIYTGDGWSRIFSAEALSRFSCNRDDAVPVLAATIEVCLDRKDYDWGRLACGALGNFKVLDSKQVGEVLPVLIRVIEETAYNNTNVSTDKLNMRGYSILALGNYGNLAKPALLKLAPLLEHRDDPLWQTYFDTAQKIDPRVKSQVDALIVSLSSRDAPPRGEAVCSIAKLGTAGISAIPELLSLVNDEIFDVRRFLAIALGKLGQRTDEIINILNNMTHDTDISVKVGAFYSLVCLGENRQNNLHKLLGLLSHSDSFVRYLSAWAVGEIGAIDRDNTISCLTHALRQ